MLRKRRIARLATGLLPHGPLAAPSPRRTAPSPPRRFDFGEAGRLLYDFVWSDFADWYIEAAKARLYGEDAAAAAQVGRRRRRGSVRVCVCM